MICYNIYRYIAYAMPKYHSFFYVCRMSLNIKERAQIIFSNVKQVVGIKAAVGILEEWNQMQTLKDHLGHFKL